MSSRRLGLLAALLSSSGTTASAAEQGTIKGTVKLQGTPPRMKGISMSKEPYCDKAHAANPAHVENVVVGEGGALQNVVVYISEGLPASAANVIPTQKPRVDQKNCMYAPHVLVVLKGTTVDFLNSDPVGHNVFWPSISGSMILGEWSRMTTSSTKITPPSGTLNIAAIPAAAPQPIMIRTHVPGRLNNFQKIPLRD